jgi:AcrR family transcriptional regulator
MSLETEKTKITQAVKGKRGRPPSQALHQKILDTTLQLIAQTGIASMSMDKVAAHSGVSKATLYNHWPSKEVLCLEAVRSLHPALPDTISNDPRTDALALLKDILKPEQGQLDNRVLARLISEAPDHPQLALAWREGLIQPRRAQLAQVLERAVAKGQLRPDTELELAVDLLIAPLFYRRLISGGALSDQLAEQLIATVWLAFAPVF